MTTYEIPGLNGHDVVYGLAKGRPGEIYLSASNEFTPGVCACIYAFDTRLKTFRKVIDFAQATGYDPESGLMPHSKVHLALNSTSDGRCFAASHFTAPAIGQKGFDPIEPFRGKYQGSWLVEYDPREDRVIPHGCLLPGEGCRISTIDEKNACLYLSSYPRNHLFQYHYRDRRLHDLGRIGQENAFGLEVDSAGNVFTTDDFGRILKYSFQEDRLEESDLFIPIKPGRRRQGNYARRMTLGVDGCLYGFGNKGSRLFRFSPETGELEDYGVVYGREAKTNYDYPNLPPPKALVQTDEQTLYIVFGGDGIYIDAVPVPNLVRFDLATRTAHDLGKFVDDAGSAAWIPQCALYCPEERLLYFGMQHTDGTLKLWETSLDPHLTTHTPHPTTHNPFGASIEGAEELPFVKASQVTMKELGWYGEGRVIPPGESAIQDLLMRDDVLYGITAGERSHLFRYAPYEQNRFVENYDVHVCDLGTFPTGPVISARLLYQDRLLAFLETAHSIEVFAIEPAGHRPHYHSLPHWDPFPCRIVRLDCAAPFPEKTAILGTAPGKVFLHTATIELPEKWKIRCLTLGNSGRVYGFYGEDNGIGEAFAIDLATLKPERIGILQVPSDPRFWMCHRCDAVCAGSHGEIYFGETDRISHLFIYHP